jgi:small subunit ribosomal protein S18
MARGPERSSRRGPKDSTRRIKKKPCALCRDKVSWVDYKDVNLLRKYMSDRGKIRARRVSGNCSQHQRAVALAIRTARELALVPYTQRTVTERGGGRGRRGERGERGERGDRGERGGRGREAAVAAAPGEPAEDVTELAEETEAVDVGDVGDVEPEEAGAQAQAEETV